MAIQITHIRLSSGTRHEDITHLWWTNPVTQKSGNDTRSTLVGWIDSGGNAFVQQPGTTRATVGVVTPDRGEKYLRTYADGSWNNNLLSLPRR